MGEAPLGLARHRRGSAIGSDTAGAARRGIIGGIPKCPALPSFVPPQLSQLFKRPPEGLERTHGIGYDGYRIHVRLAKGLAKRKVMLLTTLASRMPSRSKGG